MRIIAGTHGGRRLEVPKSDDIRPTSDKLRGAIFNALGSRIEIEGLTVLDICCGTGALGLEALSRGAGQAVFVDSARSSLDLARKNAGVLGAEGTFILKEAAKLGGRPQSHALASLFFCDPPYNKNIIPGALAALVSGAWLAPGALGVLELDKKESLDLPSGFTIGHEKIYGDTKVIYAYFHP